CCIAQPMAAFSVRLPLPLVQMLPSIPSAPLLAALPVMRSLQALLNPGQSPSVFTPGALAKRVCALFRGCDSAWPGLWMVLPFCVVCDYGDCRCDSSTLAFSPPVPQKRCVRALNCGGFFGFLRMAITGPAIGRAITVCAMASILVGCAGRVDRPE